MVYSKKYKIELLMFLFVATLIGCYKKDLDEFKNATLNIKSEIAIPLFNATITVKDSLNYIPYFNVSDSFYLTYNVTINDSISLSYDGYSLDNIQFKLYIQNNFPISGGLQV
ncbi:MAG TPA: hypothetical protein VNW06_12895, partial [Cytophagaceae bacterium]|nr:hypothetical protein [Cytophagaceae bacterium]